MGFKRFLAVVMCSFLMVGVCASQKQRLWLMEQDFVKFGKTEAYEKYKKELLHQFTEEKEAGAVYGFAEQGLDFSQFLYLFPLKPWGGIEGWLYKQQRCEQRLKEQLALAFFSTLNFQMRSVFEFLPECSHVFKTRESMLSYPIIRYFLLSVVPTGNEDFEGFLQKMAAQYKKKNTRLCFRTFKAVIGTDIPKYFILVFADSEKEAEALGEKLELGKAGIKNILRMQKEGIGVLRPDLSFDS